MPRKSAKRRAVLNLLCLLFSGLALGWLVGLSISPVIQTILSALIALLVSVSTALASISNAETGPAEKADLARNDSTAGSEDPAPANARKLLRSQVDPIPVMFMVIGLACGSTVGVLGRTHNWLGARNNILVEEWKDTGLSAKEITTRVFNSLYPPNTTGEGLKQESSPPTPNTGATGRAEGSASGARPSPGADSKGSVNQTTKPAGVTNSFRDGVLFSVSLDQCKRLANIEDEDELRREMVSSNDETLTDLAKTCRSYECLRAAVNRACAKAK